MFGELLEKEESQRVREGERGEEGGRRSSSVSEGSDRRWSSPGAASAADSTRTTKWPFERSNKEISGDLLTNISLV